MSYTKHNFSTGGIIQAAPFNEMDNQIALNEAAILQKLNIPNTPGLDGQVLTSDNNGGYSWKTPISGISISDDGNGNVIIQAVNNEGSGQSSETPSVIPLIGIAFNNSNGSLTAGENQTLTPIFVPSNATNKTGVWTSSNTSVATVNGGLITAISAGSTIITFTTNDGGYSAQYTLIVTAASGHSNNILNPASESLGWTAEIGQGYYLKVNDDVGGLGANNSYQYLGCYDISDLNLSGRSIVFNITIRTMALTKGALSSSYRADSNNTIPLVRSSDSSVPLGQTIELPEFDTSEYTHLSFSGQRTSSILNVFDGNKPLYMSTKVPYDANDVDVYHA